MGVLTSLHIKLSTSDQRHTLTEIESSMTVGNLKAQLEAVVNVPAAQQRLIYKGRVLVDSKTLAEYGALTRPETCWVFLFASVRFLPLAHSGGPPQLWKATTQCTLLKLPRRLRLRRATQEARPRR
jgi:Ubiquitin family